MDNSKVQTLSDFVRYGKTSSFSIPQVSLVMQDERVVFLDEVLDIKYLQSINANIYLAPVTKDYTVLKSLNCDRKEFGYYHTAIKQTFAKGQYSYSEQEYFNLIKHNSGYKNLKFNQFIFVTMVLSELGIIKIDKKLDYYNIEVTGVNSQLNLSTIYNFVKLYNETN